MFGLFQEKVNSCANCWYIEVDKAHPKCNHAKSYKTQDYDRVHNTQPMPERQYCSIMRIHHGNKCCGLYAEKTKQPTKPLEK